MIFYPYTSTCSWHIESSVRNIDSPQFTSQVLPLVMTTISIFAVFLYRCNSFIIII